MATIFQKILCPVDFSDNSIAALDQAAELARQNNALLFAMHVDFVPMNSPTELVEYANVSTEPSQRRLERLAAAHLENVRHELLERSGWPGGEIVSAARELDTDLIVIATHGWWTGVQRLLGDTAEHVVRVSPCPVLSFAYGTRLAALKRILCPIDFDSNSLAAMKFAKRLADEYGASTVVLHVAPESGDQTQDATAQLEKVVAENLGAEAHCELVVRHGDPGEEILEVGKALRPDLIVMATHGRTALSYLFLGSVAVRVVRESTVPVLTLRERQE